MLRRFLIARNGNRRESGHSFTIISAVLTPVFFHEGDEDSKGTCVELIQTRLNVLNIYNKDKVAQKEGDSEEGYLGWLCQESYSLCEMGHY